jgi:chemotaxis protein MotB
MEDADDVEIRKAMRSVNAGRTGWVLFLFSIFLTAGAIYYLQKQMKAIAGEISIADARATEKQAELTVLTSGKAELEQRLSALETERAELAPFKERVEAETKAAAERDEKRRVLHDALAEKIGPELTAGQARLSSDPDHLRIEIDEALMFEPDSVLLTKVGEQLLGKIAPVLAPEKDQEIEVAGHGDSGKVPDKLKAQFPTAWELSAVRASVAARYFAEKTKVDAKLVRAVGYASNRPVDAASTPEARTKNRRLEIIVRPQGLKTAK